MVSWLQRFMVSWLQRFMISWLQGFMICWFNICRFRNWSMIRRFVETKYILQTSTMSGFWVSGDGIIIMGGRGRGRQHHHWSSWLVRMMNIMVDGGDMMMRSMMVQCGSVVVHHVVLDHRDMVEAMAMDLVVFLVYGMVSPVVGHPVTHVVGGGGDGDVVVSSRYGGGALVDQVGRRSPQGREQGQGGVGRNVVGRRKYVVSAQSGGGWQCISLILH